MSVTNWKERKQGQRALDLKGKTCNVCRKRKATQRHHRNIGKGKAVIAICDVCHEKLHIKAGTWGRMKSKKKTKK